MVMPAGGALTRAHPSRAQIDRIMSQVLGEILRGQLEQGILEQSATQRYAIGARLVVGDRVFRYAQADPNRQLRAAYPVYGNLLMTETGTLTANAGIGAMVIPLTAVADVVANQFAEGSMVVAGGAGYGTQYRVRSNTAALAGNAFTATIYDSLVVGLTAATENVTLYRNPYAEVHSMRQEIIDAAAPNYHKVSWVGVPLRFITAAFYCWLQTWGPCFVVESHDMGANNDIRQTYFSDDGSLGEMLDNEAAGAITLSFQLAGPILPVTTAGDVVPSGLALINLQICP